MLPPPADALRRDDCIREIRASLTAVARRLSSDPADADDLVHDALERGLRRCDELPDSANLRAWLVAILRNLHTDQYRRRKRRPTSEYVDARCAATPAAPIEVWRTVGGPTLTRAIEQLDPEFRDTYVLHAIRGLSYDEVATRLGISKSTVGSRLHRARTKLRDLILAERG